mmetsp:Transcript_3608/g.4154  ORF Transcript_3608/g.4154 Transcript_3608/m.4154 type:complete len:200 (+) Transcript_3608:202-801(+)
MVRMSLWTSLRWTFSMGGKVYSFGTLIAIFSRSVGGSVSVGTSAGCLRSGARAQCWMTSMASLATVGLERMVVSVSRVWDRRVVISSSFFSSGDSSVAISAMMVPVASFISAPSAGVASSFAWASSLTWASSFTLTISASGLASSVLTAALTSTPPSFCFSSSFAPFSPPLPFSTNFFTGGTGKSNESKVATLPFISTS